jgi:hypothetical protein
MKPSIRGWDLDRYREILRRRAGRLVGNPDVQTPFDASDLVQETLTRATEKDAEGAIPPDLTDDKKRLGWLFALGLLEGDKFDKAVRIPVGIRETAHHPPTHVLAPDRGHSPRGEKAIDVSLDRQPVLAHPGPQGAPEELPAATGRTRPPGSRGDRPPRHCGAC